MIRRLHLVRHGPTHAKSMVGWSDLPADLSDHAQIARLSSHLPQDAVFVSSDLSRASDTADAIMGQRARLDHDPDLREMHFGDWELRTWSDLNEESPDHIRAFWETPGDVAAPNGESWNDLRRRCDAAVDRLIAAQHASDLVIVCHFGAILTQVQRALNITASEVFAHKIDNLSVSEILIADDVWSVHRVNHLP